MVINTLIYCLFVFLSFGQLGRLSFINQQINIYSYEVLLVILLNILIFKLRLKPLFGSIKKFKVVFIFYAVLLLSFAINIRGYDLLENLIAFLYFLRLFMYFIFFIYVNYYINQEKKHNIISESFLIFFILTVIFSFIQYFFYPDLRNLFYLGWDPHLYRMFGLFFDTSITGAVYGIVFIYLLFGKAQLNKYLRYLLLSVYFIFIVLTFSRSLYLALTIVIITFFAKRQSFKPIIFYLFFLFVLLVAAPKPSGEGVNLLRFFSIESRLANYAEGLKLWQKKPILGIGYNHIRYEKNKFDMGHAGASFHSSFLIILTCGGLVGLCLFLLILYHISTIGPFQSILVVFLSIMSISDNILLHPVVLFIFLNNLFDKRQ